MDTSHTGAKFTFIPSSRRMVFFRIASFSTAPMPPSAYSSCGDLDLSGNRFGFRLARVTVPPSSSEPINSGMPVSAAAAS